GAERGRSGPGPVRAVASAYCVGSGYVSWPHDRRNAMSICVLEQDRARCGRALRRRPAMKILIIARPYAFHGGVEGATAGRMRALVAAGQDVHRAGPGRQQAQPGVTEHPLPMPPLPSPARAVALALLAAPVARRGGWDVVQSHERTFVQDVYRAGEGAHRAYLEAMGSRGGRRVHHAVTLALERRVFARTPQIVAISRRSADDISRHYAVPPVGWWGSERGPISSVGTLPRTCWCFPHATSPSVTFSSRRSRAACPS